MYILHDAFINVQINHDWLLEREKSLLVFTFFIYSVTVHSLSTICFLSKINPFKMLKNLSFLKLMLSLHQMHFNLINFIVIIKSLII